MVYATLLSRSSFKTKCLAVLHGHQLAVCRLEWNITGTVLASSSDDGLVKLWKGTYCIELYGNYCMELTCNYCIRTLLVTIV